MKNKRKTDIIVFIINIINFIYFISGDESINRDLYFSIQLCYFIVILLYSIITLIIHYAKKYHKKILEIIITILLIITTPMSIITIMTIITNNQNTIDKPIIYIYPEKKTDLIVSLNNDELLTHAYPEYNHYWNITVDTNGNIYDKNTKRNYYALYWEGKDNSKIEMNEGFVVKGSDTVKFLENKLELLGLNEREIEEFIIYWLPRMENNHYNLIRFRTDKEINEYMKLTFNKKVDTFIRVYMDFKPLNMKIEIPEQQLIKKERKGFTVVEWGVRELK